MGKVRLKDLSAHDRAEIQSFKKYLKRRASKPGESEYEAYAAHYGEVVFDAATRRPRKRK